MTDWTAVRKTIQNWAVAVLAPVPVIWAEQNFPPPDAPLYVTLRAASSARVGDDFEGPPDGTTGIADLTGNRDFTLGMQALGPGAKAAIEKLRTSLEKTTSRDTLRAGGVVFVQETGQTNITSIVVGTTKYEERESLDVTMRTASAETDVLGVIEHVELGVKVKDPAGDTVVDETIPINP